MPDNSRSAVSNYLSIQVLRIQSAEGVKRVNCKTTDKANRLFERVS